MSDTREYGDIPRAVFITDKMSRFRQRIAATFLVNESSKLGSNYYAVTLEEWEGVSKDGPYLSLVVALSSNPTKADPPVEGEPEDGRWFKIDEANAAWDEYRNIVSNLKDRGMKAVEGPHNDYTLGYVRALFDLMEYHGAFQNMSSNNPAVRDAHHWTRVHIWDLIKGIRNSAGAEYLQDPGPSPRG